MRQKIVMHTGVLLKLSFIGGLVLTIIGAALRILHEPGAEPWMIGGVVFSAIFIAIALYEVLTSRHIERREKVLWTLGFVFLSAIAGLFYLLSERRRIMLGA